MFNPPPLPASFERNADGINTQTLSEPGGPPAPEMDRGALECVISGKNIVFQC